MKKVLFGLGSGLELYVSMAQTHEMQEVQCILDNSPNVDSVLGISVLRPSQFSFSADTKVVITSRHYVDIYNQLIVSGVAPKDIDVFPALINW